MAQRFAIYETKRNFGLTIAIVAFTWLVLFAAALANAHWSLVVALGITGVALVVGVGYAYRRSSQRWDRLQRDSDNDH